MSLVYGHTLYQGFGVQGVANRFVKAILKAHRETGAKNLVSRGSSGCVIASIALMDKRLRAFGHLHCGKIIGHSGRFSGNVVDSPEKGLIFVDDFIESGHTFKVVKKHLKRQRLYYRDNKYNPLEIVAAVLCKSDEMRYNPRNVKIFYIDGIL